jgi:hypothetical protein
VPSDSSGSPQGWGTRATMNRQAVTRRGRKEAVTHSGPASERPRADVPNAVAKDDWERQPDSPPSVSDSYTRHVHDASVVGARPSTRVYEHSRHTPMVCAGCKAALRPGQAEEGRAV